MIVDLGGQYCIGFDVVCGGYYLLFGQVECFGYGMDVDGMIVYWIGVLCIGVFGLDVVMISVGIQVLVEVDILVVVGLVDSFL